MDIGRDNPDHRASEVRDDVRQYKQNPNANTPSYNHHYKEAFFRLLTKQPGVPEEVREAFLIHVNDYKKEIVEAFLIAGGNKQDIEDVFELDTSVVDVYQYLFFDPDVFKDRLDLYQYVYDYEDDMDGWGEDIKINGLQSGLTFLKASYADGDYELPQVQALRETIRQAYLQAKSARRSSLDSKANMEARKWADVMIDAMESMPDVREHQSEKQADIALQLIGEDETNTKDLSDAEIISSPDDVEDKD